MSCAITTICTDSADGFDQMFHIRIGVRSIQ